MDEPGLLIPSRRKLWFKVDPAPGAKKPKRRGSGPANKEYELDFREADNISSALSVTTDVSKARHLPPNVNPHRVYQGVTPGHDGFVLDRLKRDRIVRADAVSAEVIYSYVTGQDLLVGGGHSDRFIIDFQERDVLDAQRYRAAFLHVQQHVLPDVTRKAAEEHESESARKTYLEHWWQLWRPRPDLIRGFARLKRRYVVCSRVTKRPIFVFLSTENRPSDKVQAFLFDDDYSFGILQSVLHWQWFVAKCSKLTERLSYSTESVFQTFPWPQSPAPKLVAAVAEAGREVRRVRDDALTKVKGGLRAVYRTLELPGKNPLKDAHAALDAAALAAYGFSPKNDLLAQLLDLNLVVAAAIDARQRVTAPGIPPGYPNPKSLVTADCIRAT